MSERWGIPAAVFALKCYAAAILSIFVAFSIGLERPYWAFLTSFIVAGPLAGAVLSKALFRLVGTFIGAVFSVLVVPPLVQSPELLTLAMGLWMGLCVFVSLLDRTPRAYMFVLAGYSAALIVFPTVETPDAIFTVASLRGQEIAIGIVCSALVHGVVLPRSVSEFLIGRVDAIVADAERWSRDALSLEPPAQVEHERKRLAADITELHQLSTHLPFETNRPALRVRAVRALQDQLSVLMPLGAAVADRIACLSRDGALDPEVSGLLGDTRDWLGGLGTGELGEKEAALLVARSAALEPSASESQDWHGLLRLSLLARLGELIEAHVNCRLIARQMATWDRKPVSPRIPALLGEVGERQLHRDVLGALRGAAGAFVTIVVGCALWIGSGWSDGSTAVMLAGIFLSLFAAFDSAQGPLRGFLKGTVIATILGAAYGFAILPAIDGFPMLAAALAPPVLVLAAMLTVPRFTGFALPALLGLGSPFIISETYVADFATFANAQLAQLLGILFAIVMARLLQTARIEQAIRHTLQAGWRDIAERATLTSPPDVRGWIARMLDRLALLGPRLAAAGKSPGEPLYDLLADLRTGVAIGELRQLRLELPEDRRATLTLLLEGVSAHYRRMSPEARAPQDPELLGHIDEVLRSGGQGLDAALRRRGALALISLRRNLFPSAAPLAGVPA